MSYATISDMQARYGDDEIAQLGGASDIAQALADAAALIDGHLAGRYTLPLSSVPPVLRAVACDLARERLYKDAAPEVVSKRGDEARRFLAALADGRITLGIQPAPEAAGGIAWITPGRVMRTDMTVP